MDPSSYLEHLFGHAPRPGIQRLLEVVESADKNGKPVSILLEAPTSYGKTEASVALAAWLVKESSLAQRLIHILPLRAIVEESFMNANSILRQHFPEVTVGAQAMHLLDAEKSPFFLSRLVYTTIDSFVYNLFKLPVAEPSRDYSHFDIPRYAIYSALQIFDEAHYFASDDPSPRDVGEHQSRMFAAYRASLCALTEGGVPLAVATATMPKNFLKALEAVVRPNREVVHIKVGLSEYDKSVDRYREMLVQDRNFFGERKELEAITRFIKEKEALRKIIDHHSCADNVLIVRNTVRKASDTYALIKERGNVDALLIHGRMTFGDKKRVLDEAKSRLERKRCILVSTQIVEAGVNLDFDVIVTDAAPAANLIQRIGRVGRRPRKQPRKFYAYLLEGNGDGVYEQELTTKTLQLLKDVSFQQGTEFYVGWRLPERTLIDNKLAPGFVSILESTYQNWSIRWDSNLSRALAEIDRYWQISQKHVREFESVMCSFVRTSGVISLAVLDEGVMDSAKRPMKELWRETLDRLISVDLAWLLPKWREVLDLNAERGTVRYVSICEEEDSMTIRTEESPELFELFEEGKYDCKILSNLNEFLRKRSTRSSQPVALKVRRSVYGSRGLLA